MIRSGDPKWQTIIKFMQEDFTDKGGTSWTEVLDIQDDELKDKLNTECASGDRYP
jgi:hypothetical protein